MLPTTSESIALPAGTTRYMDTGALATGSCEGCGTSCINLSKVKEARLERVYGGPSFTAAPAWVPNRILRLCGTCTTEALAYAD